IGSSERTARLCGVRINRTKVAVYAVAGACAALAGVMEFSKLSVGDPTVAVGLELDVIAAVIIGGGSLSGGKGSVVGTIAGAAINGVAQGCSRAVFSASPCLCGLKKLHLIIRELHVIDLRFPTSKTFAGTDAVHVDPDYSAAYVVLTTDAGVEGHGLTFTIGRGNEVVVAAVDAFRHLVVGRRLEEITPDFAAFWHRLASDSQLRWL